MASSDQLAREVRRELLDTDLAKVVPRSYSRLTPEALRSPSGKVGDAGRGAVLVQIESVLDIGYSASSQLEIAEARREARRANVDPNYVPAGVQAAQPTQSQGFDHMASFQAQEDDKVQASTLFPRRMLKLELSDGSMCGKASAIELQRISGLDMNTTRIGSKLLLKGALIKDDYLLLTPKTAVMEGGVVQEKDKVAEDKLIMQLRAQLGKPGRGEKATPLVQASGNNNTAVASSTKEAEEAVPERSFSPDEDESMLLAMLADEEEVMASTSKHSAAVRHDHKTGERGPSTAEHSTSNKEAPPPTRKRATLIIPEGMSQTSAGQPRSQQVDVIVKPKATQEDPISLVESDDDDLVASIPDTNLSGAGNLVAGKEEEHATLSNSRYEPIVIESSPEP